MSGADDLTAERPPKAGATAPILALRDVYKSFGEGETRVDVLHAIDLEVRPGELVALVGPSGSGKSTLLNLIGLLDRPTAGKLWLEGHEIGPLDDAALTRLRGEALGFVFQSHHLVPALSVVENVMMPAAVRAGGFAPAMKEKALGLLEAVGLAGQARAGRDSSRAACSSAWPSRAR